MAGDKSMEEGNARHVEAEGVYINRVCVYDYLHIYFMPSTVLNGVFAVWDVDQLLPVGVGFSCFRLKSSRAGHLSVLEQLGLSVT